MPKTILLYLVFFFLNNQGNLSEQYKCLLLVSTFCKFNACFRFFVLLGHPVKSGELAVFISCTDLTKSHPVSNLKQWIHAVAQGELKPGMILSWFWRPEIQHQGVATFPSGVSDKHSVVPLWPGDVQTVLMCLGFQTRHSTLLSSAQLLPGAFYCISHIQQKFTLLQWPHHLLIN